MHNSTPTEMQRPTHSRLHIRNAHDAHVVFEAVRQGFLPSITRRLDDHEKATLIKSGAVFCWEESDSASGLRRWTDGRLWSQSRMREPYLFYDEKLGNEPAPAPDPGVQTFRFVNGAHLGNSSSAFSHRERSTATHGGLVKQAYSVHVLVNPTALPRKWHIVAYFLHDDLPCIPTVDQDECLRNIIVPAGLYRSGKTRDGNDDESAEARTKGTKASRRARADMALARPTLPSMLSGKSMTAPMNISETRTLTEDQRVIRMLNGKFY